MAPVDRNNPRRADSSESQWSLMEFMRDFPDDSACLEWLWVNRYSDDGEHADCPKCGRFSVFRKYQMSNRNTSWTCTACGNHVSPTAGTIFHKSSTSLHLWFYAMYLMTSTRCGISAKQLERELGVTYKTAWRMFTLIRNELMTQDDDTPLSGDVEMDETYVGGRPRGREIRERSLAGMGPMQAGQAAGRAKKTTVFGMVERGGRVAAHVVPPNWQATAFRHIEERVLNEATVYTDEAAAYQPLGSKGYQHRRIHHAAKVYVGDVHTNTIEGFWSLVKRGIGGTHHAVSAKYLQGYLNEYVWRYNHRKDGKAQFLTLLLRAVAAG